jgi:peptidoglycan/xylan/chitin deacetylase (PgdA/CDA1 family)/MoaA/NifB/PqqE/SkfB family radical SAM enzyme/glycosyltransferase involved in cell wall biosynthesis
VTTPGIAVVVACHDLGRTVEEAVDSALAQTRPPAEIVVVDDGSTDVATRQILRSLARPRTRVVTLPHAGVAAARNHGVALTSAPYVVLLDADDALAPRALERLGARLDADAALDFVSCAVQAFEGARYVWKPPATTVIGTLTRGSVHISSLFRRTVWDAVGGFDPELPAYEDLDFWLHALRRGFRGAVLDEALLFYRVREGSRYRAGIEPATYRRAMERIFARHRAVLDAHGIDVLAEKEAFLVELSAYHRQLRAREDGLAAELARLDREIAAATRTLAERGIVAAPATSSADLQSAVERALEDRRWLLRGAIAVVADAAWALDGLRLPRWDAATSTGSEEKRPLHDAGQLPAGSKDCVVIVAVTTDGVGDATLTHAAAALKPGGVLLVIAARPDGAIADTLARLFPLETFEVDAFETDSAIVVACVRPAGAGRLPRLTARRRTAPIPVPSAGIVLAYHRIADLAPDTHGLCVPPARFREHLAWLREHCTPMPLAELVTAARRGVLPPRAVAVTLDDGYLDALTTAAPLLVDAGIPATFFVNTERLAEPHEAWHDIVERILLGDGTLSPVLELVVPDGSLRLDVRTPAERRPALMTLHGVLLNAGVAERDETMRQLIAWSGAVFPPRLERRVLLADEIRQLARRPGCDIGSHSEHHLLLTRHADGVQRVEIARARATLERLIDRAVVSFAYPFGEHDDALASIVRETPHLCAVTVEAGLVTPETDPFRLPRLPVTGSDVTAFAGAIDRLFAAGMPDAAPAPRPAPRIVDHVPASAHDHAWAENDRRSRDAYASGQIVLTARPQFLILDPTSRCNARCVMCPVSFRAPGDHGVDLHPALFDKVASLIPTASQVNLFSSGEPTIAKDLPRLIDEVRRRSSRHAQIWLSTNGKRLPAAIVDGLMHPRIGLQFSVDGGTREVFEPIRRGIAFEELCRSLELVQQRKGSGPWPALSFSSTISKRNLHDLANIFALARRYGVGHVYFYEEDPEAPEEEAFALDPADRPVFEAQRTQIDASGVRYSNGLAFRGADGLRAIEPAPPAEPPTLHCRAPWKAFHVRADGTVRTCCTLRTVMGDLNHQTVDEIWNGPEYAKLRRAFVEQAGIPGTCYRCTDPLRTWDGGAAAPSEPPPPPGGVDFGSLRRLTPMSESWGFDRGHPIDRFYIDGFVRRHAADIRGHVLEVGDDHYTRRFGGDRVTRSDVLHVRDRTAGVTIVADLTRADHLPSNVFDCIVVTQTLQLIDDVSAAIRTLHRMLKPGGVLLATMPGITPVVHDDRGDHQWWTFTARSARRLFEDVFPTAGVDVEAHGNLLAATAFLHGLAVEELRRDELEHADSTYDVVIAVRAVKTPGADRG